MNAVTLNKLSDGSGSLNLSLAKNALGNKVFGIKKYLENEQKELLFNKKSEEEETEYFSFIKFLFSSPDEV